MKTFNLRVFASSAFAFALVACACDGGAKSTATADPPAKDRQVENGPETPDADAGKAGGDKVKVVQGKPPGRDERYELVFDTPDAKAGEESKVTVRVVPKDPWHMNLDYPTSLAVDAPSGVTLSKAELEKGDAKKLDADSCEFDVAFTAANPGEQTLTGEFKFAVCQDEACSPVTESVELKVAVK
jgi:hypothetical protein